MKRKAEDSLEILETFGDPENAVVLGEAFIGAIMEHQPERALKGLVAAAAPLWYQNKAEEMSCLHAAAYVRNAGLLKYLIERGAVWNAIDNLGNTAGDIALSFNDAACYTIIRDAGIRQEMLLHLLSKQDNDEDEDGWDPTTVMRLKPHDRSAAGNTDEFLSSKLTFRYDEDLSQPICEVLADDQPVGVMMGWERDIMHSTVTRLAEAHPALSSLKILNVGFGLGIIDNLFESLSVSPTLHVIIEAHPDVLAYMRETGWYSKPNVKILEGKWQQFINSDELLSVGGFDIIYTDTFSEDYQELYKFFQALPDLLADQHSRFSFFNGLGATNALFYDVYTHVADLHLSEIGLDVQWSDVPVREHASMDRWGGTRKYFTLPLYRLGIATLKTLH